MCSKHCDSDDDAWPDPSSIFNNFYHKNKDPSYYLNKALYFYYNQYPNFTPHFKPWAFDAKTAQNKLNFCGRPYYDLCRQNYFDRCPPFFYDVGDNIGKKKKKKKAKHIFQQHILDDPIHRTYKAKSKPCCDDCETKSKSCCDGCSKKSKSCCDGCEKKSKKACCDDCAKKG